MKHKIGIIATLDTKGREADYLRAQIERFGDHAVMIDTGVLGTPIASPDISREEVAAAGGCTLAELRAEARREVAAPVMADGATAIVVRKVKEGTLHGLVALGGTQGTTLATKVMRALPYGFPKVMVSTIASGNVAPWVDIKDITMMFSVADILGLNALSRRILANAAGAVCGMADATVENDSRERRPLVAVTTVGITTKAAIIATEIFDREGYDSIVFHAIGPGGRAMEAMMKEGLIDGVLDLSIIEVSNQIHGALLAGGDERLTVAGKLHIPQVICPGAVEVLVFNEPETIPSRFRDRPYIRHSPQITDVRLNKSEMIELGHEVARRLQYTRDTCLLLIPTAGYDSYAVQGQDFHDPEADAAFVAVLRAELPANIRIIERATDIENPAFAAEAAMSLIELMKVWKHS